MKRSSVFYTVSFVFLVAIASMCGAFWWLRGYDQQNYTRELNTRYSVISRVTLFHMSHLITDDEYRAQIQGFEIPEITDGWRKEHIIKTALVLEEISDDIGTAAILYYKKRNFLLIKHADQVMLLEDDQYQPYRYQIFAIVFGLLLAVVIGAFVFVLRRIKPLRKIKRQIDRFAGGDLNIRKISYGNDEISEIGEAFYDAVMQIRQLNESRQLFLRNIMHELKTPITRGRITTELLEDGKNKERLIDVFGRLEMLINEFAAVESITSGAKITNITQKSVNEIITEAVRLLMAQNENIDTQILQNSILNVDFKLFSIAVKNMIDNAIKYSNDKSVQIIANENAIEFISSGDALEQDLTFYTQAFTKGSNAKQSFGLGLYIVSEIVKAHGLELTHRYEDGKNIFGFAGLEKITSFA